MPGDMMDWVTSNPIPMAIIVVLLLAAAYLYMGRDSMAAGHRDASGRYVPPPYNAYAHYLANARSLHF